MNASGQVVGYSDIAGNVASHAFRTAPNGSITAANDLGTLGGSSSIADGINSSGQTVGYSEYIGGPGEHAFRTTASGTITAASDLGTLGGLQSFATAINDAGQVVGASTLPGESTERAFLIAPGGAITAASDLGALDGGDSYASAINNEGQIVGDSTASGSSVHHAFIVDGMGQMVDLNTLIPQNSGWVLEYGEGINDAGQITGVGTIDRQTHAFLLTPTPEPSSLGLLALGLLIMRPRRKSCTAPSDITTSPATSAAFVRSAGWRSPKKKPRRPMAGFR